MSLIGVRELKEQTSKVIRQVREERAEYVVTYKGKPVAVILPLDTEKAAEAIVQSAKTAVASSWDEYEKLAQEIRDAWPDGLSTQELIDAIRR
jgi:prevent-host-death family protein